MPTYDEVKLILQRGDTGLLFLVGCVAYAVFAVAWLGRRHPRFARVLGAAAPVAVPLGVVLVNPFVALLAALLGRVRAVPRLWWVLLLAVALRLPIMGQSLWYDEAFSLRMTQLPFQAWTAAIANDVHPPGFYYLLDTWAAVAQDHAFLLRLLPLAFGLLHVWLIHRICRVAGLAERGALTAAVITALLPAHVYYSTELRSYTVLACVYAWAALSIIRVRPAQIVAAMAVAPVLHNFGLLYAGCIGLAWIVRTHGQGWRQAVLGGALASPWLLLVLAQSGIIADGYFPYISPGSLFWPFVQMTIYHVEDGFALVTLIPMLAAITCALWLLVREARHRLDKTARPLLILMLAPLLVAALVSVIWRPVYVPRTFFPAMMLLPVALALLVEHQQLWRPLLAGTLAAALVVFYTDGSHNTRLDYGGIVEDGCAPGLPLYTTSIPAAFVMAANTERALTVWDGATDDAGTFTPDDLPVYGFSTAGQPPAGEFCLFVIDQPLTADSERAYVGRLLDGAPHAERRFDISRWHVVYVYEVSNEY